jgi:hypothetical protein
MALDPAQLLARLALMKSARANWDSQWQEIRDLIYPDGGAFNITEADGSKTHQRVYDGTAEHVSEDLCAFLHGMLTNPAVQWFALADEDEDINEIYEVSLWTELASRRMFRVFASPYSNFAPAQNEKNMDLIDYGTGGMFIQERPGNMPLFHSVPLAQLYVSESHEGRVDTVFRDFEMTARQAVQRWGDAAGKKVVEAAKNPNKQDEKFKFLHAVFPRTDRTPGLLGGLNMPFVSVYVNQAEKTIIKEDGFPEMPYVVPRWRKRSQEAYGRGPGAKALADVKMLQRTMKSQIRGVEKTIDPTLMLPDDGIMSPMRRNAGGHVYVRSELLTGRTDPIRAINSGARIDLGEDFCQSIRDRIGVAYFSHLMRLSQDPRMTATQVLDLAEKTQTAMGPTLGRLEAEDLGPIVDRTFACCQRAKMFPPAPPELSGRNLQTKYLSPVARAQRLAEVRGMSQTMEVLAPLAQTHPELLDNFEIDKSARRVGELLGWPRDCMRAPTVVAKMRKERAKTVEQENQFSKLVEGAGAAGQAAKALPALQQIMGGQGGMPANDSEAA